MSKEQEKLLIYSKFQADKEFTLAATKDYLDNKPVAAGVKIGELSNPLSITRGEIVGNVGKGDFGEALKNLDKLRDLKTGITQQEILNTDGTPVVVRDARKAQDTPVRETEAFEMQYLNAIRAGIELAGENAVLKRDLQNKAIEFINDFPDNFKLSQKELSKKVKGEIKDIAKLMEDHDIGDAYNKLNVAKDFQNFNDTHSNVVTISSVEGRTVVEAEVALKELTPEQKAQYQAIIEDKNGKPAKLPRWYTAMPPWEQELTKKYAEKIIAGKHVIPTQLRQIAGMRNAFEKITLIDQNLGEGAANLKTLHTSKHAGAIASLARDKDSRENGTNDNAYQAREWVGKDVTLHCNTFNSGPIGAGDDPEIVKRTTAAMNKVGGKETNTAFNALRLFGGANDLRGVKESLTDIARGAGDLQSHIKPRSRLERLFGLNKPKGDVKELLNGADPAHREIYKEAIELRKLVEKADVPFRIFGDRENLNLQISTKLNLLANKISALPSSSLSLPKESILNMCASGKDRTGLAEHDQSAQAIAAELKIDVKKVDGELLKGGHTAQQAGGIHAGGGTLGCYGTKSENKAGIPQSRKEGLLGIVEESAATNRIKGKSKKVEQNKAPTPTESKVQTPIDDKKQTRWKTVTKPSRPPFVPTHTPPLSKSTSNSKGV